MNDHDQTQDVYFALTYLPTTKLKVESWVQVYEDRTNEIAGVNRVTEDFIKNGNYIAGPASPTTTGPTAYFGYDIITFPNPPPFTFGSATDGSYSIVNPATAHTIKLPNYVALIAPGDVARAFVAQGQVKATLSLTPDSSLVNRLFLSTGHSNKSEEVGYSEYVPKDVSIQDRAEYRDKFDVMTHREQRHHGHRLQVLGPHGLPGLPDGARRLLRPLAAALADHLPGLRPRGQHLGRRPAASPAPTATAPPPATSPTCSRPSTTRPRSSRTTSS